MNKRKKLSDEEIELLKSIDFDINLYNSFNLDEKEICLKLIKIAISYDSLIDYYNENGWDFDSYNETKKLLKKAIRIINNYLQQKKIRRNFEKFLLDSKENFEDDFEKIFELENKYKKIESMPPEEGFFSSLWSSLINGLSWSIKIFFFGMIILLIIGILFYNFMMPIAGKCYSGENPIECYIRVDYEEQKIYDFNLCQQACGVGIGNEICLEKCEYKYQMGKWKSSNIYRSSTGQKIECPSTQKGYETETGDLYCY